MNNLSPDHTSRGMEENVRALSDIPAINRFLSYCRVRTVPSKTVLIHAGDLPDVLYYVDKYQRGYNVANCLGLVFTTNYSRDSLYIPPGDRRFFVAWTELDGRAHFSEAYWTDLWHWYQYEGGFEHVAG